MQKKGNRDHRSRMYVGPHPHAGTDTAEIFCIRSSRVSLFQAGISKGLIYRYFTSKEEILLGFSSNIESCVEECQAIESAEEAIRTFIMRLLSYPYYQDYIPPMRIFFTAMIKNEIHLGDQLNPFREEWGREYFGRLFQKGQEQGAFRPGDPMVFGDFLWKYLPYGMIIGLLPELQFKGNVVPEPNRSGNFFSRKDKTMISVNYGRKKYNGT